MIVQEPLQAAIWHCLNSYDYTDAVFLAERLVAEVSSNESVYLLASAYHRSGETAHANHILRTHGPRTPKLRYLHAVTAHSLNRCVGHSLNRYPEAESVLVAGLCSSSHNSASVAMQLSTATPNAKMMNLLHDTALTGYGVHACFALRLLGELYQKTQRPVRACVAYRAALAINPFLFTVFQRLLDAWPGDKLVDKSTTAPNNNSNNNNNNSINNNSPSSNNNNNNTTTSTCGNNTHAYDTDPDDIFTLDKLSDLNCCHGNTLCTVVNSNDTYVNPSTVPGTAHGTGKTSTFITPASTGGATPLSVLSVCGNRSNVQQVGTPLGNIMLSCSQLYTPVGGTPASMAAPLLPPPLHQAPRKKAPPTQLPSLRTKQATAAASAMLSLNAPSLHAPLTPNFGVIPLDMTPLTPTSPNPAPYEASCLV
ncbi:hypothetical protein FHG87_017516 [Trinorchestia longiramus]|nr:hypothetical protein FHG87_017516 [Trinorchestia longiramus]